MKGLQRRFLELQEERPSISSFLNLAKAIEEFPCTRRVVSYYFNRLVEQEDYADSSESDRREYLQYLYSQITPSRMVGNRG